MQSAPSETVVFDDGGIVVGTANMGPNRPGYGDHDGTGTFMVAPEVRGRGIGRQLGEYVVQWHLDRGFRAIQFNAVVETNTVAIWLWRSLGSRIVGTVPRAFRSRTFGMVGLHVMHLEFPQLVGSSPSDQPSSGGGPRELVPGWPLENVGIP